MSDIEKLAPDANFHEFVYFNRECYAHATGRTIWSCGEYFFLVSSIINEEMEANETMVFQCNSFGEKTNGSEDLAYSPDPYPTVDEVKDLVRRAYLNLHESNLRESIEHFVRYEADPKQLESIKTMFMTPKVFD